MEFSEEIKINHSFLSARLYESPDLKNYKSYSHTIWW